MTARNGERLYDLPAHVEPLEAARGSLFAGDWAWLRSHDLYARYVTRLPADLKQPILAIDPAAWVPVRWSLEHSRAIDAVGVTQAQAFEAGYEASRRLHGAFFGTLARVAGALGVTPWTPLASAHKLWTRTWRGGSIAVERAGSNLARVIVDSAPMVQSAFHRASLSGAIAAGVSPFCHQCEAVEIDALRTASTFTIAVRWR